MRKRMSLFISALLLMILLVSCNLTFTDSTANVSTVFTDETTYEIIETSITETVEEVQTACVAIYVTYTVDRESYASIGSGVIYKMIDSSTEEEATEDSTDVTCYVVTNEHVIDASGSDNVSYYVYIGDDTYFVADPVGSDASNDLAILTFSVDLSKYDLTCVSLDDSEDNMPIVGNTCIAIGTPISLDNFNYVTVGNVSKVTTSDIMHTAAINPGNSGGALFSITGKLIGINYAKTSSVNESGTTVAVEGMGYAIPIWTVKTVVSQIESANEAIVRPTLGITITTINTTLNSDSEYELPNTVGDGEDFTQGVVVLDVTEGSNASRAISSDTEEVGLQSGDVIYMIEDTIVSRSTDISYELNLKLKGDKVTLVIFRKVDGNWTELTYTVTLN